ncbi:hypothetical protein CLAFUR0_04418 [Fulvia fulva]|nr:hypothetical protein CLAFUR0_04418 [Fulvia fulva]
MFEAHLSDSTNPAEIEFQEPLLHIIELYRQKVSFENEKEERRDELNKMKIKTQATLPIGDSRHSMNLEAWLALKPPPEGKGSEGWMHDNTALTLIELEKPFGQPHIHCFFPTMLINKALDGSKDIVNYVDEPLQDVNESGGWQQSEKFGECFEVNFPAQTTVLVVWLNVNNHYYVGSIDLSSSTATLYNSWPSRPPPTASSGSKPQKEPTKLKAVVVLEQMMRALAVEYKLPNSSVQLGDCIKQNNDNDCGFLAWDNMRYLLQGSEPLVSTYDVQAHCIRLREEALEKLYRVFCNGLGVPAVFTDSEKSAPKTAIKTAPKTAPKSATKTATETAPKSAPKSQPKSQDAVEAAAPTKSLAIGDDPAAPKGSTISPTSQNPLEERVDYARLNKVYTIPPYTKEGFYNVGGVARPPIIFDPSSIPELDDQKLQTIIAQHRAKMSDVSKAKLTTEDKELLEEVAVVETKAPEHASGHDSDDETGNQEVEAMRAKLQRLQTSISMYPYRGMTDEEKVSAGLPLEPLPVTFEGTTYHPRAQDSSEGPLLISIARTSGLVD